MKHILIAEDDKFLASAYKLKLSKMGYEITVVADGQEAIDELNKSIPDLILLDLVMPKKDGFATLQEIKANEEWKHIPVIVASNLGQKEDVDRAASLGAAGYIIKTAVTISELVEKVKSVLAKL
jgi:two-component system phosphate regulon response regulator PhoB/two-component system alkaline phosphatase synthesis response regulator PhoP